MRCAWDEDGNGLDDGVEDELARCVAPGLSGDGEENAWEWDEPKALWTTVRTEVFSPDDYSLRLFFGLLWRNDGGFVTDTGTDCTGQHHAGDSGLVVVDVRVVRGSTGWMAHAWAVEVDGKRAGLGEPGALMSRIGTHPWVYPSAGKHHLYIWVGTSDFDVEWAGTCKDKHRAGGPMVNPAVGPGYTVLRQAMNVGALSYGGQPGLIADPRPIADDGTSWLNLCTYTTTGERVAARRLQRYQLDDIGFPGFTHDLFYPDSATYVEPPSQVLNRTRPADTDGDGLGETHEIHYQAVGSAEDGHFEEQGTVAPVDPCPLHALQGSGPIDDPDGDGLDLACDPEPVWYSPYVAGGSEGAPIDAYPAATDLDSVGSPWRSYDAQKTSSRGGFLDRDRDMLPEGEDSCPGTPLASENRNGWAEIRNWTPGAGTVVADSPNTRLGVFQRADACDPYPVAVPTWSAPLEPSHSRTGICALAGYRSAGQDDAPIRQVATVGISHNDSAVLEHGYLTKPRDPKVFWTQTHRCACRGFEGEACVVDPSSDCYRNRALPAVVYTDDRAGRGWRQIDRPDCSASDRDDHSFCNPYRVGASYFSATTSDIEAASTSWAWKSELATDRSATPPAGWINHFAPGDFTFHVGDVGGGVFPDESYYSSNVKYVLWTMSGMDMGAEKFQAPGPLSRDAGPGEQLLPDPEKDTDLIPPDGPNTSEKSRLLRSGLDSRGLTLESFHGWFDPIIHCPAFNLRFVIRHRLPETFIRWPDQEVLPASDVVYGTAGPLISDSVLIRTETRTRRTVALTLDAQSSWVASAPGLGVPVFKSADPGVDASLASTSALEGQPRELPDLLWVERGETNARWARLGPVEAGVESAVYAVVQWGKVGESVGLEARLVADEMGMGAAIVDLPRGQVLAFDPALQAWMRPRGELDALQGSGETTVALVGSKLVVGGPAAPGESAVELGGVGSLWLIDALGGSVQRTAFTVPARRNARLLLSEDRRALLLVGGTDLLDAAHDDVWAIPFERGSVAGSGRLVRADSGTPALANALTSALLGSADGQDLRIWAAEDIQGAGVIGSYLRTSHGWSAAGESGEPAYSTCDPTDAHGGELCPAGGDWWANPGRRACVGTPSAGACQGNPGVLTASIAVQPSRKPIEAATDGTGYWLLTQDSLERWTWEDGLNATLLARATLPAAGRTLAVQGVQVLVGTAAGVLLAVPENGGIVLSPSLELCGRPVQVAAMGGSAWAVATTQGIALVTTGHDGAPRFQGEPSMFGILPGVQSTSIAPLPVDAPGRARCRALDGMLRGEQMRWTEKSSAIATVSPRRLLVARGPFVVDVDVSDPGAPMVRDTVSTGSFLSSIRVDRESWRAYATGEVGPPPRNWIIDLRGDELQLRGQHDVNEWVERREAGDLVVRLQGPRTVELARVAR